MSWTDWTDWTGKKMTLNLLKEYSMSHLGIPYKWGGDDPMLGYDCSGFVQELLMSAGTHPNPKQDFTAQGLYNYFAKHGSYNVCSLGSLAFYGKSHEKITHIAFCLDQKTMIEAGGGGSRTIDSDMAAKHNAYVRIRPINNRSDLVVCIMPKYKF